VELTKKLKVVLKIIVNMAIHYISRIKEAKNGISVVAAKEYLTNSMFAFNWKNM
jgi:hypothetical protein